MRTAKRVLVVDDELGIRILLSETLEMEGFDVSVAEDGQDSLEQMEGGNFDLVITDLRMPRIDGIEMIQRMRASGRKEKVIVLTGSPMSESALSRSVPSDVVQLTKPIGMASLMEVVATTISD
ncbi:MAG: response regulator [Deltaproteobacteria bacterium]|nr:response regulator [Deltaproteobacteria bacterium]MBW1816354.1 response regulator [Deltaproteobacteria bacterium]MBW2283167.1 response regulator [Deltaproteobacteria bacterium]